MKDKASFYRRKQGYAGINLGKDLTKLIRWKHGQALLVEYKGNKMTIELL